MTLPLPVTYEITAGFAGGGSPFRFVFEDVFPSLTSPGTIGVTSNINFTINGGTAHPINAFSTFGSRVFVNEATFSSPALSIGDIVVLSAGTLTTNANVAPPSPDTVRTDFSTFIAASITLSGGGISGPGTVSVSVPDSLSTLWLGLPIAVMLAFAHQLRRFAARFQSA
jgi:hypothetical protein